MSKDREPDISCLLHVQDWFSVCYNDFFFPKEVTEVKLMFCIDLRNLLLLLQYVKKSE